MGGTVWISTYRINSDNDIRGDWIVKKTGIDGLCEAIDKIYSMPEKKYQKMRSNCRSLVEESFSANRMVEEYLKVYKNLGVAHQVN